MFIEKIERPNHMWCAYITYIPIGWGSRAVLSWRLSNSADASLTVTP
jgi:putative transposase